MAETLASLMVRMREARWDREGKPPESGPSCRLHAANAGKLPPDFDLPSVMKRLEKVTQAYWRNHPDAGDENEGETPARRTRQRKPSIAALIRQARKAGERGPVRVTLLDGTSITSESEASIAQMAQDDAEALWKRRVAKNAAH